MQKSQLRLSSYHQSEMAGGIFIPNFTVAASQRKGGNMIDILCEDGTALYGVQMSFQAMRHLLKDGIVPDDDFVELAFENRKRGQIKKKYIVGFCEAENTRAF